jgi:hypothetical protein
VPVLFSGQISDAGIRPISLVGSAAAGPRSWSKYGVIVNLPKIRLCWSILKDTNAIKPAWRGTESSLDLPGSVSV